MKIQVLAAVKSNPFTISSDMFGLFKPDDLPVKLLLSSSSLEIKVLSETENMFFDEFMHEVGFVLTQQEMTSNLEELKKIWALLCQSPKIEYAPIRSFADISDEAVLTREVLKKAAEEGNPHCNRYEFKSMAFDLYIDMGFDKTTFRRAVHQYA